MTELIPLADDVYMFRAVPGPFDYITVFIVTDEGVIAADPISLFSPAIADAYKAAIRSVTAMPVKYVVYSHDHADHITGGTVFADTAEFISHELAAPKIAARNDPRTPIPTITFAEHLSLTLGSTTVELHYTGRNHSDNSIVLLYPDRRLLFAVDFVPVNRLPFRDLQDSYPEEWVDSLDFVETGLDFDLLVPGHGQLGNKDTAGQVRAYLLDLMAAIRTAREQGLADNSEEMAAAVRVELAPAYGAWENFDEWLPENIAGIIRLGSGGKAT